MNEYTVVSGKGKCGSAHGAIYAYESEIGREATICTDPACKTHGRSTSRYALSPSEKERRKKDAEKAKKERAATEAKLTKVLGTVRWPLSAAKLDALLALAMSNAGSNAMRSAAKRHELEVPKRKTSWGSSTYDYEGAVKKWAEGLGKTEKARLVFELMTDDGYGGLRAGLVAKA